MKPEYVAGRRISKATAQVLGEKFEEIRGKVGSLTAKAVVDEARSKRSPLHDFFEWDDAVAAEKHRLSQASELIRSVMVVIRSDPKDKPREVRALVSIVQEYGRSFEPIAEVLTKKEWREQMLSEALQDLEEIKKKYRVLTELAKVFAAIEDVRSRKSAVYKVAVSK